MAAFEEWIVFALTMYDLIQHIWILGVKRLNDEANSKRDSNESYSIHELVTIIQTPKGQKESVS